MYLFSGPLREVGPLIQNVKADQLPQISLQHFMRALKVVRPSVTKDRLLQYQKWYQQQSGDSNPRPLADAAAAGAPAGRQAQRGLASQDIGYSDGDALPEMSAASPAGGVRTRSDTDKRTQPGAGRTRPGSSAVSPRAASVGQRPAVSEIVADQNAACRLA